MLVNTAGHANFEADFAALFGSAAILDSTPSPISSIFDNTSHIYTCFAFGNKLVIYQNAQYQTAIAIDSSFAADDHEDVEALLMNYDQAQQTLRILIRYQKNTLKSFQVDLASLAAQQVTDKPIGAGDIKQFARAATTAHHAVLEGEGQFQFLDIKSLKVVKTIAKAAQGIQARKDAEILVDRLDDVVVRRQADGS